MARQPQTGTGEGPPGARVTSVDAAVNRRRSEELRHAADEARDRAGALGTAVAARRGGKVSFRDQMAVWQEVHRTLREMEETARELDEQREVAEREVAEQTAWVRREVESMLDSGWSRGELAEIGIGDEVLAQVGMLDDPRLRGHTAGDGDDLRLPGVTAP